MSAVQSRLLVGFGPEQWPGLHWNRWLGLDWNRWPVSVEYARDTATPFTYAHAGGC